MQIHQILIRPETNTTIILYVDVVGRRDSIVLESQSDPLVQQLIEQCKTKLPVIADPPAKEKVEQEISELEYRLAQLKESIGVA
jgi:hypothetical protein